MNKEPRFYEFGTCSRHGKVTLAFVDVCDECHAALESHLEDCNRVLASKLAPGLLGAKVFPSA